MKKLKIRETLYVSSNLSELCFNIDKADEHFRNLLHEDIFPQEDLSKYISIEVVMHEDYMSGFSIESVRFETDEEYNKRVVLEGEDYKKYLKLKERFKHYE